MKFRIGQRVKQVRGRAYEIGATGTVVGFDCDRLNVLRGSDVVIAQDGPGLDDLGDLFEAGEWLDCNSQEWEPIQDRPALSTWDAIRKLGIDVHAASEALV